MKNSFFLILSLIIEVVLLIFIAIVLFFALIGVFLPVLPSLFFLAIAIGIYSLMIKSNYTKLTGWSHPYLNRLKNKILTLKITQNFMDLIKAIKKPFSSLSSLKAKRKQEKVKEEILKHGLILFGFNVALTMVFFFGFIGLSFFALLMKLQGWALVFIPLLAIFLFASASAIVWYRFGQILGGRFKKNKIINSAFVVLVSILPFFALLLLLSAFINLAGGFANEILLMIFLSIVLMSVLSAAFSLLIISLGAITSIKK